MTPQTPVLRGAGQARPASEGLSLRGHPCRLRSVRTETVARGPQRPAGSDLVCLACGGLFARTLPPRRPPTLCAHIIYGPYFAQKHALLVVETSFAFPETNDGGVFSFGGQSRNVFYVDNDNIIFYNLFAFLYFADFIARINPRAEASAALLGETRSADARVGQPPARDGPCGVGSCRDARGRMRTRVQVWACAREACEDFLWLQDDLQAGAVEHTPRPRAARGPVLPGRSGEGVRSAAALPRALGPVCWAGHCTGAEKLLDAQRSAASHQPPGVC